ncbi:MAG: N-acetylglucosamine-6-phosphate deacetylase [Candidatus Omnitrophota bacterium]
MDNKFAIRNGGLILGDKVITGGSLRVYGGRIKYAGKRIPPLPHEKAINAKGNYICPGFIDIHAHGMLGKEGCRINEEGLSEMCSQMARSGVTSFLATTVSLPPADLLKVARAAAGFVRMNRDSNLIGLHFEGPFVNRDYSGAQNKKNIFSYRSGILDKVFSEGKGLIKAVTFAPESKNAMGLLKFLSKRGVVASIGHSNADYGLVKKAVECGAKHVTHLFNAMPAFHHRKPGIIGAALTLDGLSVDIIADGLHLDPVTVKLAVRAKGTDKVILISDTIDCGKKDFKLGGLDVRVGRDGARLRNGSLAGSVIGLNDAVRNVMKFAGISLPEAVKMVTANPARLLSIDGRKGSLEAGKDADIVVFDRNIDVKFVSVKGRIVFNKL